jgi:hypothetical protein
MILIHFFIFLALTDIKFDLPPNSNHFQRKFHLKFKKDNTWYSVNASEYSVTASEVHAGMFCMDIDAS